MPQNNFLNSACSGNQAARIFNFCRLHDIRPGKLACLGLVIGQEAELNIKRLHDQGGTLIHSDPRYDSSYPTASMRMTK